MSRKTRLLAGEVYGTAYRRARRALLASGPMCHWCQERPATTADHVPPVALVGPHLHLVPACRKCNYGRRGQTGRKPPPPSPSREW
jgi:hypothetical protein